MMHVEADSGRSANVSEGKVLRVVLSTHLVVIVHVHGAVLRSQFGRV